MSASGHERAGHQATPADDAPAVRWQLLAGVVAFALLYGMWIALVGEADRQDLVAGAGACALAVGVGYVVGQRGRALPAFRHGDLRRVARLLPRYPTETVRVFAAAARHVRHGGGVGRTVTVQTDAVGEGWPAARRSAVVGAILSATPNTVLIDLDDRTGQAVVHVLAQDDGAGAW